MLLRALREAAAMVIGIGIVFGMTVAMIAVVLVTVAVVGLLT